jgi:hypothetical protein
MGLEKMVLPLATQQKYRQSHRVSLLPISGTQEATRMLSPTSGPRTMLAPHFSDCGSVSTQGGRQTVVQRDGQDRPNALIGRQEAQIA